MSTQKRKQKSLQDLLSYMHMLEDGISFSHIHKNYGINEARLKVLWSRYQKEGISGLQKCPNIKADYALKHDIVLDIEENHLTLHEASLKYGASPQRIGVWLKIMRTEGIDALSKCKKRGRPSHMGRPKKNTKPQSELERLRKENEELRLEVALLKKSESLSRGKKRPTARDWARAIEELRQEGFALECILKMVNMARSVFYYHLSRLKDNDGYDDTRKRIKAIYDDSKGRYGYRRICMSLRNEGCNINHKTVLKLMSQMELKARRKKRHYHSYKGQIGKVAPNVINRNFSAERPNQKWTTDVSQVCIKDEKLYISPILDMYNGEIITYTLSRSPNLKMVTDMLKKAF